MDGWSFLTNHARALLCIARDPGVRLRDIAAALDITERTAYGIVNDLSAAAYVVKDKDGRRNRYQIQAHLPLPEAIGGQRTIGEVLTLLVDASAYDPFETVYGAEEPVVAAPAGFETNPGEMDRPRSLPALD
ncbi:MAG: helix-turn-helix transcriptional regulator, partial [Acidimicrobiia bacterium]